MENPKTVFSREQILNKVWGVNTFLADRTVDVHILRLRKLLRLHCVDDTIATIRGVGYFMAKESPK